MIIEPVPKWRRFEEFIVRLWLADSGVDRADSLSIMRQEMQETEEEFKPPEEDRMRVFGFECGWEDLDGDPSLRDDRVGSKHRANLYNDGGIKIVSLKDEKAVLIGKPGAVNSLG